MRMHNPPHPSAILKDALEAAQVTVTDFAAHIGVARPTLSRIPSGRTGITAEMSIKRSDAFSQNQPDLWFKLQNTHDFWVASQQKPRKKIKPLQTAA